MVMVHVQFSYSSWYNKFELQHEISNNVVCATSKSSDQPGLHTVWSEPLILVWMFYDPKAMLKHHLEFLRKGGCIGSSESSFFKMPHCCKIHEPWHEISNNVVCATSKSSDQPDLHTVWSEPLLVIWIFYNPKATGRTSFGASKKRGLHRLVWVYICQNATLL